MSEVLFVEEGTVIRLPLPMNIASCDIISNSDSRIAVPVGLCGYVRALKVGKTSLMVKITEGGNPKTILYEINVIKKRNA